MSLIFVDHFVYNNGSYDCYYDTGDNTGKVQYSGPGQAATFIAIPNSGRAYNQGDLIRSFCSDNPSTTKVNCYASPNSPFFTVVLEQNSATCTAPPPATCDAVINSVVPTAETQQGGKDGKVVINASSSAGGIQYSIDNVTYQTSNSFAGLQPANYTAYIKDANNCSDAKPFTILAYNNPVQNYAGGLPVVNLPGGNISKWNASFNPVVVNYQRKDFTVTAVSQYSPTQVLVKVTNGLTGTQYQEAINNGVYLNSGGYILYQKADSYDNGLVMTATFIGNTTTGFLNIPTLRKNFYVETELTTGLDPVTKNIIVATHSPDKYGATRADLQAYVSSLLSARETYDFQLAVYRDVNLAGSFQARYREIWDGGSTDWYKAPYALYYTYAAMQLQEQYGGNMANYVPFKTIPTANRALWLTDRKRPELWLGLPFELSFIYSEHLLDVDIYLEVVPNNASTYTGKLLNADSGYITNKDTSRILIERLSGGGTGTGGYMIKPNLGVNRVLIPQATLSTSTYTDVNLYYLNGSTKVYIMKPLRIDIVSVCKEPYVYLKWINHLGAWDYYRFGFNLGISTNTSGTQQVSRFVMDWANGDTIEDNISRNANKKLTIVAPQVREDAFNALSAMQHSISVQMMTSTNPYKWKTIVTPDGDTPVFNTHKGAVDLKLNLTLPAINIQRQ